MAADSSNDLELALKKRARRRLVGAIALVLLMVIILPMVLQDRAALAPKEAIKITMPEDVVDQQTPNLNINEASVEPQSEAAAVNEPANVETAISEQPIVAEINQAVQSDNAKPVSEVKKAAEKVKNLVEKKPAKKPEVNVVEPKKPDVKVAEVKAPEAKPSVTSDESFTIQVGVYSDMANVKQLQARLKQVGLDSHTENITTPKGEKIRLRAGRFNSRQEAAYALTKLQAADLTGMVISNN